ncbi:MAG: hypothetical protein JOZ65_03665, partial [Chloroflexi bacterium]|nr:hypothetical protein [Chloroflexota bacterium]
MTPFKRPQWRGPARSRLLPALFASVWTLTMILALASPAAFAASGDAATASPAIVEFPVPGGGDPGQALNGITEGPDGAMWVTEARTSYDIGRFDFRTHTFRELPL